MRKLWLSVLLFLLMGSAVTASSINGDFEGNPIVKVYGNGKELISEDVPAVNYNGRTMIPIYMLKQLGSDVEWNGDTYSVNVKTQSNNDIGKMMNFLENNGGFNTSIKFYYADHYNISTNIIIFDNYLKYYNKIKELLYNMALNNATFVKVICVSENYKELGSVEVKSEDIIGYYNNQISEADLTKKLNIVGFNQSTNENNGNKNTLTAKDIAKLKDRVAVLVAYDQYGKAFSQGSGFVIGPYGTFISNAHVVNGSSKVDVLINNKKYTVQGRIFLNEKTDLYANYLAYDNKGFPTLTNTPYIPYTTVLPEIGDKVYAIGSPEGLENTISEGIVSGIREVNGLKYIQHTAGITHGSSGGVLLNEQGEAIGVTSSGVVGTDLNFAIPMMYVKSEFDKLNTK